MVPDSASTATSMFSGVKVNSKTGGVDASVKRGDCMAANNTKSHLSTIMKWAQAAGKATGLCFRILVSSKENGLNTDIYISFVGFVTTTRITHATPMSLYAHTADREWECDSVIPKDYRNSCKDIARQLVEDEPGKYARVRIYFIQISQFTKRNIRYLHVVFAFFRE